MKKILAAAMVVVLLIMGLVTGCTGIKVIGSGNLITKTLIYIPPSD